MNRYFAALTLGGLVFFAACGTDSPQTTDETFFDDTQTGAPVTPAPAPTTDPMVTPTDTLAPGVTDPAAPGVADPATPGTDPTTTY
jgi:hypothetical protein